MAEIKEFKNRMIKTAEVLSAQFDTVRAGRANAAVLDQIEVDYYGTPTPIRQIASISSPDARTLLIQPWDGSTLKLIEKAILTSELGINPQNDGRVIRLVFPQLTEERRKELAKQVRKYGEEAKVAVRNIRRDAMDKFKKEQKKGEITEDDLKDLDKDMQKLTDDYTKEVDKLTAAKEKELFEIWWRAQQKKTARRGRSSPATSPLSWTATAAGRRSAGCRARRATPSARRHSGALQRTAKTSAWTISRCMLSPRKTGSARMRKSARSWAFWKTTCTNPLKRWKRTGSA